MPRLFPANTSHFRRWRVREVRERKGQVRDKGGRRAAQEAGESIGIIVLMF